MARQRRSEAFLKTMTNVTAGCLPACLVLLLEASVKPDRRRRHCRPTSRARW